MRRLRRRRFGQQVRPGIQAGNRADSLPLPVKGYQAYLIGEMHGIAENEESQLQYLELLRRGSGLRDVAIEEDAVYQEEAEAFVEGRSDALPASLCLRAGVLRAVRQMNDSG